MISKDVTFVHCHCPVHIVHMPEMHIGLRYELRLKHFLGQVPLDPQFNYPQNATEKDEKDEKGVKDVKDEKDEKDEKDGKDEKDEKDLLL